MRRALIVVDVQNDFCPGGALACSGGDQVAASISTFIRQSAEVDLAPQGGNSSSSELYDLSEPYLVVIGTKDWHIDPGDHFAPEGQEPNFVDTWPVHCEAGSPGAQSHPNLDESLIEYWFLKGQYDAAYSGFEGKSEDDAVALGPWLKSRGIDAVDICGIATDYCVKATALDAVRGGFSTRVLEPLCAGVADESTASAIQEMESEGVVVVKK